MQIKLDLPILLLLSAVAAFGTGHLLGSGFVGLLLWMIAAPYALVIWLIVDGYVKDKPKDLPLLLFGGVSIIASLVLAFWAFKGKGLVDSISGSKSVVSQSDAEPVKPYETPGHFGDSFGPVTALFSAITLAAAMAAYWSQREELKDSRKRVEDDKNAADKRQFESTFFQLLGVFHEVVNSVVLRTDKNENGVVELRGREVFRELSNQFTEAFKIRAGDYEDIPTEWGKLWTNRCVNVAEGTEVTLTVKNRFEHLRDRYEDFFWGNSHHLSHYFRTLYRLFDVIHDAPVPNKKHYAKIVRAQLSDGELVLLFCNGLSWMGEKMNQFVFEYALLRHLIPTGADGPRKDVFPTPEDRLIYGPDAGPAYSNTPEDSHPIVPELPCNSSDVLRRKVVYKMV